MRKEEGEGGGESPSIGLPLNWTLCSSLKLASSSREEKLISRDTALHFRIFLGTRAEGERGERERVKENGKRREKERMTRGGGVGRREGKGREERGGKERRGSKLNISQYSKLRSFSMSSQLCLRVWLFGLRVGFLPCPFPSSHAERGNEPGCPPNHTTTLPDTMDSSIYIVRRIYSSNSWHFSCIYTLW